MCVSSVCLYDNLHIKISCPACYIPWGDLYDIYEKEINGKDINEKENYRPVSLLSHMSKVFKGLLYKQIETFMSNKLLVKLCGFHKKL